MTPDVVGLRVVRPHVIEVSFADGVRGVVDLADELDGPVFEPLRDPDFFGQARMDAELGTVVWPNGADFSPEFLYAAASSAAAMVKSGGNPRR